MMGRRLGHNRQQVTVERFLFAVSGKSPAGACCRPPAAPNGRRVRAHRIPGSKSRDTGTCSGSSTAKPDYMAQLPKDDFSIVLHHYPFGAFRAAELGVQLYLAGHTHGGQVQLPLLGGLYFSPRGGTDRRGRTLPRRFASGLHRLGRTWVHISRGLGTRGGDAPPIRFGCRPEISLLRLVRSSSSKSSAAQERSGVRDPG